jgi:hypoxanthine phosphoribosyltransferase
MKDILQAWNFKTLQEFSNIIQHISNNGKTIEDVLNYVEDIKSGKLEFNSVENKKDTVSMINIEKKCEQINCHGMMELYTVCCSDIEKKKEGYFTKWECKSCGFVEYDKRRLEDIKGELNA